MSAPFSSLQPAFSSLVPIPALHTRSLAKLNVPCDSCSPARSAQPCPRLTCRAPIRPFPLEASNEGVSDFNENRNGVAPLQDNAMQSTPPYIPQVTSADSEPDIVQNENGSGNVSDSQFLLEDDLGTVSTNDNRTEELYLNDYSYPISVLDWCSTIDSEFVDEYTSSAHAFQSERLCSNDRAGSTRVERSFVNTFRMSSPYIHAHQGQIFVIHIPGDLIKEPLFASVMEDIALMRVVGIKLVLVLGPHALVAQRLKDEKIEPQYIDGIRVTDAHTFRIVKEIAGSMRFEVECALAKGVTNMPSKSRISVLSGNFFSAQPVGIIDGADFGYTGKVRRVDAEAIRKRLSDGDILLLSNVGSSPSGQQFNCKAEDVAADCAAALKAEKLIFMGDGKTLFDRRSGHPVSNLTLQTASKFLQTSATELPLELRLAIRCSVSALERGVMRAHILNRHTNGVLLMEAFHRDGAGLMISRDLYEGFRPASLKDVNGVKEIIEPLENQGILKKRSFATLERDIDKFVVIERDGMIIACLSLTVMEDEPAWAELGCVAVHKDYRKLGKGDAMVGFTERMAYNKGVRNLFVLSTQSFDWFYERGFSEVSISKLPESRQALYDCDRRSKIFHKLLQPYSKLPPYSTLIL